MKHHIITLRAAATAALIAAAASLGVLAPPAAAAGYAVQSITPWMQNAAPVGWSASPDRVFYNSLGSNGFFNGYSANPDGSDPACLTCTTPTFPTVGTETNRGVSDVSPNGQYMLVTVERPISNEAATMSQPGKGGGNDVYLYTTNGQQSWPLTNIYAPGSIALGSIWPRFDRTGNEIVWSSMISPAVGDLGYWQLKVANIVWTAGVPSLADIRTIEPTSNTFYEAYGFTPNDQDVIFASNTTGGTWLDDQIDEINVDGTGLTQLSQSMPSPEVNYNEFAFFDPTNTSIIFGRSYDTTGGGMDYWTMNADGSDPQRLTYFNEPWNTEGLGHVQTEALAFNPDNPNQFLAGVATDANSQNVDAELVTLNPSTSSGRLTEQFYSGLSFNQLISTTTEDPSEGFKAQESPAPGVPASDFSIRWSGGVTIPETGTYMFCAVADANEQLYLNGTELVNAPLTYGQRECGSASEVAGTDVGIQMDYWHGVGPAYAQLSWVVPGSAEPTMIPSSDLSPATPTAVSSSLVLSTYGVAPTVGSGAASGSGAGAISGSGAGAGSGATGSPSGSGSSNSSKGGAAAHKDATRRARRERKAREARRARLARLARARAAAVARRLDHKDRVSAERSRRA